jgi:subfamily B ATP-binding cassette protein HlyB/CyaB
LPFLALFLALMLFYSAWLSLLTLLILALVMAVSLVAAPLLQMRLNEQFLLGAAQPGVRHEYVAGIETVKSLQMEPQLERRYEQYLADYLRANFKTRQLGNTYNARQRPRAVSEHGDPLPRCVARDAGTGLHHRDARRVPDVRGRGIAADAELVGLWQQFQQAAIAVRRLGDVMNVPRRAVDRAPGTRNASVVGDRVSRRRVSLLRRPSGRPAHFNSQIAPASASW